MVSGFKLAGYITRLFQNGKVKEKTTQKAWIPALKNYSPEMLALAIEHVQKGMSHAEAERVFGIPRRTISNKVNEKHKNPVGPPRFSEEEENRIVKLLIAAGDFGSPFHGLDLRIAVFN